jgi:hypothetical protein
MMMMMVMMMMLLLMMMISYVELSIWTNDFYYMSSCDGSVMTSISSASESELSISSTACNSDVLPTGGVRPGKPCNLAQHAGYI